MKTLGQVKSVVVGGRPRYAPMQAVGGTKGSNTLDFAMINGMAKVVIDSSDLVTQKTLTQGDFANLILDGEALKRVSRDAHNTPLAQINFRDHIRKGDITRTPLQFVYEAADCRLFYTVNHFRDVRQLWRDVAATQWGNVSSNGISPLCVRGSTGHPSAISKEGVPWGIPSYTVPNQTVPGNWTGSFNTTVQPSASGAPNGTRRPTVTPVTKSNTAGILQVPILGSVIVLSLVTTFL